MTCSSSSGTWHSVPQQWSPAVPWSPKPACWGWVRRPSLWRRRCSCSLHSMYPGGHLQHPKPQFFIRTLLSPCFSLTRNLLSACFALTCNIPNLSYPSTKYCFLPAVHYTEICFRPAFHFTSILLSPCFPTPFLVDVGFIVCSFGGKSTQWYHFSYVLSRVSRKKEAHAMWLHGVYTV